MKHTDVDNSTYVHRRSPRIALRYMAIRLICAGLQVKSRYTHQLRHQGIDEGSNYGKVVISKAEDRSLMLTTTMYLQWFSIEMMTGYCEFTKAQSAIAWTT